MSRRFAGSSKEERQGSEQAEALGLYVLFEGVGKSKQWIIYDRKTGRVLGWWNPSTKRYRISGVDGTSSERRIVLRMAAGKEPPTRTAA
jgi:hypothetical protein